MSNLQGGEHTVIRNWMTQWVADSPELSLDERKAITARLSDMCGQDLLAKGVLLTGSMCPSVGAHHITDSALTLNVSFDYTTLERIDNEQSV